MPRVKGFAVGRQPARHGCDVVAYPPLCRRYRYIFYSIALIISFNEAVGLNHVELGWIRPS